MYFNENCHHHDKTQVARQWNHSRLADAIERLVLTSVGCWGVQFAKSFRYFRYQYLSKNTLQKSVGISTVNISHQYMEHPYSYMDHHHYSLLVIVINMKITAQEQNAVHKCLPNTRIC